ncbi:hypothetical protein BVC80_645g47 [Macleaya cordata]|uniref:Uncharacterized protein n=1 Tax=Macleaya cordata TaxID=56857 RepID=A0A200QK08_MACCD|nr:hypothetical protein BVC80_645g47 [Macleaya cordata]
MTYRLKHGDDTTRRSLDDRLGRSLGLQWVPTLVVSWMTTAAWATNDALFHSPVILSCTASLCVASLPFFPYQSPSLQMTPSPSFVAVFLARSLHCMLVAKVGIGWKLVFSRTACLFGIVYLGSSVLRLPIRAGVAWSTEGDGCWMTTCWRVSGVWFACVGGLPAMCGEPLARVPLQFFPKRRLGTRYGSCAAYLSKWHRCWSLAPFCLSPASRRRGTALDVGLVNP